MSLQHAKLVCYLLQTDNSFDLTKMCNICFEGFVIFPLLDWIAGLYCFNPIKRNVGLDSGLQSNFRDCGLDCIPKLIT